MIIENYLRDYKIKKITEFNYMELAEIYTSNDEFFLVTEGEKSDVLGLKNNISSVPPNFDLKDKLSLSFWKKDEPIAILDILKGYPNKESIWIGLLLIHGDVHSKGIGSEIVDGIIKSACVEGFSIIQLGVIESNKKGLKFWEKQGFRVTSESFDIDRKKMVKVLERTTKDGKEEMSNEVL